MSSKGDNISFKAKTNLHKTMFSNAKKVKILKRLTDWQHICVSSTDVAAIALSISLYTVPLQDYGLYHSNDLTWLTTR